MVEFKSVLALVVPTVLTFPSFVLQVSVLVAPASFNCLLVVTCFAKGFRFPPFAFIHHSLGV